MIIRNTFFFSEEMHILLIPQKHTSFAA